jgi:hypothetical protein
MAQPSRTMSDEHKAALALGRDEGRAVRAYLEALEASKPKRGRKRTRESVERRLAKVQQELPNASPVTRLQLVQERIDLQAELDAGEETLDLKAVEQAFVKAAKGYSERKGISYAAWRQAGVPAAVLRSAGVSRS